jgi:hypothetical protein
MIKPRVGVHGHFLWDGMWANGQPTPNLINQLNTLAGIGRVRVDIGFASSMPTSTWNPTSGYNKRVSDFLNLAQAHGIQVLLNPQGSPQWSRPETAPASSANQYPSNLTAWRQWIETIVSTWGSRVEAWEIWNEPNISAFTGITDPAQRSVKYAPVLKEAYLGAKAVQANSIVVFGGPSQTDSWFIDESFYRGLKGFYDVMSWHPYQSNETKNPFETDEYSKGRVTHTPSVLEHMAYWKSADVPIWWTEVGVSVHPNTGIVNSWELGVETNAQAALHLVDYLRLAQERYPQVEAVYTYVARKDLGGIHQVGYSIMEADGTPKPQLIDLAAYARGDL